MEPEIAHRIASKNHAGQRNRFGGCVIDHVERVAAAVPADARDTALLHDLLELCPPRAGSYTEEISLVPSRRRWSC